MGDGAPPPPGVDPSGAVPRGPSARLRPRHVVAIIVTVMFTAFAVAAVVVPLPWYYAFRPGTVRDTEPLIEVQGTETYESEGSVSYTTVSLGQPTLAGLLWGWIDDDIDVHSREEVLGGRDAEENRSLNLQLMDTSKEVAAQVALEHLGYEVPVTCDGMVVRDVQAGSPADGEMTPGDTIVALDGERLDQPDDLSRLMEGDAPGDRVTATLQAQDGQERDVELSLAASPDDPDRGIMGVVVQPRNLAYDFPVDVEIETGDVGGPSAGLAFSLGILDDLTPGELTGGEPVAATGEIRSDGTILPVGGTGQKAASVRAAGIDLFLVPRADYEDAVAHAGDVEVVPVDTLEDALRALADNGGNALDLPRLGDQAEE